MSAKLSLLRKNSIPKQTDWSLSVWSQWSSYRFKNLVEVDECVHELKQEFTAMTEEALLFWLPKFVAEIRKSDGSLYPPNSVYQICCGLSRALKSALWMKTSFRSVNPNAAMVGTNFQLLIFLVPRTSQSISTLTRTKFFSTSLELLLLFCIDPLLCVQVF